MKEIDDFSNKKAHDIFDTLPNSVASEKEYYNFSKLREKQMRREGGKRILRAAVNIAAVLFIPLALFTLVQLERNRELEYKTEQLAVNDIPVKMADSAYFGQSGSEWQEYVVNPGVKGKIVLPDGSEVWLNSKSSLKVHALFDSLERRVRLSGEAYFKVNRQKNWPMIVETGKNVFVKVTGTEFNMKAYGDDNSVKLTLIDGAVELISERDGNIRRVKMKPAEEMVVYDGEAPMPDLKKEVPEEELDNSFAWKDGYLIFNNTPMDDVIKILERWYGVTFNPVNEVIGNYRFTARFKTESITRVLDLLSISSNIKYGINENIITLHK